MFPAVMADDELSAAALKPLRLVLLPRVDNLERKLLADDNPRSRPIVAPNGYLRRSAVYGRYAPPRAIIAGRTNGDRATVSPSWFYMMWDLRTTPRWPRSRRRRADGPRLRRSTLGPWFRPSRAEPCGPWRWSTSHGQRLAWPRAGLDTAGHGFENRTLSADWAGLCRITGQH